MVPEVLVSRHSLETVLNHVIVNKESTESKESHLETIVYLQGYLHMSSSISQVLVTRWTVGTNNNELFSVSRKSCLIHATIFMDYKHSY